MDRALGLFDGPQITTNKEIFSQIEKEIRKFMNKYGKKVKQRQAIQKKDLKFLKAKNKLKISLKTKKPVLSFQREKGRFGRISGGIGKNRAKKAKIGPNSLIGLKRKKEQRQKLKRNK